LTRIIAALVFALSTPAFAETAEEIMDKARAARQVDNSIQSVKMIIVSKSGSERVRELELKMKRDGDIRKSLAKFTAPSDVAGTQLLLVDHPDTVDEQLLYMPAIKRTNRISGKARKGSFMGSDFAYEDMEMSDPPDASHAVSSENETVWVIDTTPGENSSYGRILTHVTKADFVPRKIEFFDDDGAALKILEVSKTELDGELTLAVESTMKNLQKGTATKLIVLEHQLNVPTEDLPDEVFTKAHMEKGG
jgi:outer membrane lipoprotein-sorting protein